MFHIIDLVIDIKYILIISVGKIGQKYKNAGQKKKTTKPHYFQKDDESMRMILVGSI